MKAPREPGFWTLAFRRAGFPLLAFLEIAVMGLEIPARAGLASSTAAAELLSDSLLPFGTFSQNQYPFPLELINCCSVQWVQVKEMNTLSEMYQAMIAADEAYQMAVVRQFGAAAAPDARYEYKRHNPETTMYRLRYYAAHDAWRMFSRSTNR